MFLILVLSDLNLKLHLNYLYLTTQIDFRVLFFVWFIFKMLTLRFFLKNFYCCSILMTYCHFRVECLTLVISAVFNWISTFKTCSRAAWCFWGLVKHYPVDWKPAGDCKMRANLGRFPRSPNRNSRWFLLRVRRRRECQYPATSLAYWGPAAGFEGVWGLAAFMCMYMSESVCFLRGKISWSWENNMYY